jgi:hypothetical protein
MSKQTLTRLVCLLAALSLGLVACESKEDEPTETTEAAATDDGAPGGEAAVQAPATKTEPAVTVEQRREVLLDSAREQAAADVTEENADEVAAKLEAELDSELGAMEKAE